MLTEEEPHITQQAEPQQSITYFYMALDLKLAIRVVTPYNKIF
jgi:hypothetical protein